MNAQTVCLGFLCSLCTRLVLLSFSGLYTYVVHTLSGCFVNNISESDNVYRNCNSLQICISFLFYSIQGSSENKGFLSCNDLVSRLLHVCATQ